MPLFEVYMATQSIGNLEVEIGANTTDLKKAEQEVKKTGKTMEATFTKVGSAISAALSVEAARRVLIIADNMVRLEGTIKRLTRTTGDFNKVWSELSKVSNENGIAIGDSVALFQRFQSSLENITDSNQDVIAFIDNLQKLGRIGGSSAEELSNALIQLSQGLSGGIVRAEEWNSVMEQAPEILKSAANNIQGINGDVGKLRQVMLDGELTADKLFSALQKGAADTNKEFAELPRTIDMASIALKNNFAAAIAEVDKQIGASGNIAKFIDSIAEGLSGFAEGVSTKPLIDAQNELLKINQQIKKINDSTASRITLEKALKEAINPAARVAIQKSLDSQVGSEKELNDLQAKKIDQLKLISALEKPKKTESEETKTVNTKKKFLFQQEGFGELSDQDAKDLDKFSENQKEKEKLAQETVDEISKINQDAIQNLIDEEDEKLREIEFLYESDLISFEQKEASKAQIAEFYANERVNIEAMAVAKAANEQARIEGEAERKRKRRQKDEENAAKRLTDIFMIGASQKEKSIHDEAELIKEINELENQMLISSKNAEEARAHTTRQYAMERIRIQSDAAQVQIDAMTAVTDHIADQMASSLVGAQSWSDGMKNIFASLAAELIKAGGAAAFGGHAGSDNIFAQLFTTVGTASAGGTGGGRAMGGNTSGMLTHPINERGTPEILNQAGKQYLLPTGQNGTITPLSQNQGGGTPNISMINMGTPQEVQGVSMTKDGIEIMIADSLKKYDQGLNAELGRPNTAKGKSLSKAFKMTSNVGRS